MKILKPAYIVFLFPLLLYANTWWNDYSFDDTFVIGNPRVEQGIRAIPEIFTSYYYEEDNNTFGYRPVVQSIFAVEVSLWGKNPGLSHLLNTVLYAALCLLLYCFLRRLFAEAKESHLLFIVLLFASHPVHSEAVASLKNREELVAMLLGLSSLYFFLLYSERGRFIFLIPVPLFIFLAVLSKENALTWPLLMPLVYFVKHAFRPGELRRFIVPLLLSCFVFAVGWFAWKMPGMILPPADKELFAFENPLHTDTAFTSRLWMAGVTLGFYFKILLIPYPLRFYYGFNLFPETTGNYFFAIAAFALTAFLVVTAIRLYRRQKEIFFYIFFFFLSISVFTNYLIPVNGIVGERLVFQASLGFCGLLVAAATRYYPPRFSISLNKVLIFVIVVFSVMTFQRNRDWKDTKTLLEADIAKLENSAKGQVVYASFHLAEIMNRKAGGQYIHPEAARKILKHYQRSVEIDPGYISSYNNIGTIFLHLMQQPDSAIRYLRKALAARPGYTEARFNLANCFLQINLPDSARMHLEKLLNEQPDYSPAYIKMSDLCLQKKDFAGAAIYAEKALQADSVTDAPLIALGNLALLQNDTVTAVGWWEKAVARNPRNPGLLYGLFRYFKQTGDSLKAKRYDEMFRQQKK